MDFHSNLRKVYPQFIRNSCKERNCNLNLQGLDRSHLTILHTDNEQFRQQFSLKGQPLCDYLLFYDRQSLTIVAAELKSGQPDVDEAWEQIVNGAKVAEQISAAQKVGNFFPLLLYHRINSTEIKNIRRLKVSFRGKPFLIITERCGSTLRQVLAQHSR